jgi:carbamoyltransferase
MKILGISAFYHDSAACLIEDGEIVAAAQEERFSRRKHDAAFPASAIRYCLSRQGISLEDLDYVVFYEKPILKFERLLETYLAVAPRGLRSFRAAMPLWLREKLFQRILIQNLLQPFGHRSIRWKDKLLFSEHHLSHAASAFFPSPFDHAAILTVDGVGEWATTSTATGSGSRIEVHKEIRYPHSLGLLYSAFTQYLGFKVNSGEYKMMGLAPYGEVRYAQLILDKLLDLKPDGSYRLNLEYFDYCTGLSMVGRKFESLFGGPCRGQGEPLNRRHFDLAASVQAVLEEAMLRITRALAAETGMENLCMAGGVALNCASNGRILRDGRFKHVWIQPAAGDSGGALGAALAAYHLHSGQPRDHARTDGMQAALLGPEYRQDEIEHRLEQAGARFASLDDDRLILSTVAALLEEKAVGWFQGRMEFGPRALGARSILADPRAPRMREKLAKNI